MTLKYPIPIYNIQSHWMKIILKNVQKNCLDAKHQSNTMDKGRVGKGDGKGRVGVGLVLRSLILNLTNLSISKLVPYHTFLLFVKYLSNGVCEKAKINKNYE